MSYSTIFDSTTFLDKRSEYHKKEALSKKYQVLKLKKRLKMKLLQDNTMEYRILLLFVIAIGGWIFNRWIFKMKRRRRRNYYRNVYLKSDAWKRKRYVVLKRDNWKCAYCGARATQVHHKKYTRRNIGKEPIKWLVSICKPCHDSLHD